MNRVDRALTQRILFVQVFTEENDNKTKTWRFEVIGASGSTYFVELNSTQVTCTCPDYTTREQRCKHIYFILLKVLRTTAQKAYKNQFSEEEIGEFVKDIHNVKSYPVETKYNDDKIQNAQYVMKP